MFGYIIDSDASKLLSFQILQDAEVQYIQCEFQVLMLLRPAIEIQNIVVS